jgi:cytochrome P450
MLILVGYFAQSMQPPHFFSKFILGASPRLKNGHATLDKAVDEIIASAVNDKSENGYGSSPKSLLHLMLKTQESSTKGKTLSMYDIHSESKTLIMAEHVSSDTSTICIDETERMEYLGAFLQEVLRLYPPTVQVLRVAQGHELIEGVRVPAGTRINIQNFLMHRNPE